MDDATYRERLYAAFAGEDSDLEEKIDDGLAVGSAYLDLPVAFLTEIEDGTQEIVQARGSHELIRPGETCPLDEAYCRRTVEVDGPLAIQNASVSSDVVTEAVERFDLGTYIGAKVRVDDEVYGTVCFADDDERGRPFSDAETMFVELLAELLGQAIERRAYERRVRERNERLRAEKRRFEGIAENSFDILFRLDRTGTFTYVSAAVERILGYTPDEVVGMDFAQIVEDASVERALSAYADALDGEPIETLELDFLAADGETVAVAVNATPFEDDGAVAGIQGVGRDVTARKERERELRLRSRAMDEADIGISIADATRPDNPLIYVNHGFEELTGYDADEMIGRNSRFLQGPATDPETTRRLREHIEDDRSVSVDVINYRADGTPFWNRVQVSPVENDAGDPTHYLGFQMDITERKRTQRLIQLLNRVLRHNLRNDLNALLGFGTLIAEGDDDAAELGERILATTRGLIALSEQARDLEQTARRDRDPRRLDLESVVGEPVRAAREQFPGATVDLRVRTDRDVCAGPEVETAVAELLDNAISHNDTDSPRVTVTAVDEGEWVETTVADNGPGIGSMEAEVIARGKETALEHGTGLGLWLVNWIVTRYGGSFQISPREDGRGSVATVRLPAMADGATVAEAARGPTVLFR